MSGKKIAEFIWCVNIVSGIGSDEWFWSCVVMGRAIVDGGHYAHASVTLASPFHDMRNSHFFLPFTSNFSLKSSGLFKFI
ncbi:MAG: hypothetical protein LBU43_10180 [Candidatus Accumulibacter sp.]|jgi:hypothetical protein|nr:hypothetical protein [Accumulibacter sp.]